MLTTYTFYIESYGGSLIPAEQSFRAPECAAAMLIKRHIHVDEDNVPFEVQFAVCAAAEVYWAHRQRIPGLQSETTDGYSASYDTSVSVESAALDAASIYLGDQLQSVRWV